MTAVLHRPIAPEALALQPIDDRARAGAFQLLFGAGQFAVARWTAAGWTFPNGIPLPFEPEGYRP